MTCWGSSTGGRTLVPALSNPRQVAVGAYHACALDLVAGVSSVKCWGDGANGQTTIPALTNPRLIAVADFQSCALDDSGIICWGGNSPAQKIVATGLVFNDNDGDGDGVVNSVDALPFNPAEAIDTDGDGRGNNADIDDDGDGIVDVDDVAPLNREIGDSQAPVFGALTDLTVEALGVTTAIVLALPSVTDNNLNAPTVTSDYQTPLALGAHQITWTTLDFVGNSSSATQIVNVVDTTAPVIDPIPVLAINAKGLLTDITPYLTAVATDSVDGEISVMPQGEIHYRSGIHQIPLGAIDKSGNRSNAELEVNIQPLLYLETNKDVTAGSTVKVVVKLSGPAVVYPVVVNYRVSGDGVANSDGQLSFSSGTELQVILMINDNAVAGATAILTLLSSEQAVVTVRDTITLTVIESNMPPRLAIRMVQNDRPVKVIVPDGGLVTLHAEITDINSQDSFEVSWDADVALNGEISGLTYQLDPTLLAVGSYGIKVAVAENNTEQLYRISVATTLVVADNFEVLSLSKDSDGGGINDANEGYGDTDHDGIADYLDNNNDTSYLPIRSNDLPIQTSSGLQLAIGTTVIAAKGIATVFATISEEQLIARGGKYGQASTIAKDVHFTALSEIVNFTVTGLTNVGGSIPVVVPLAAGMTIPDDAFYRKFIPESGWFTFTDDGRNQLSSALKDVDGNCPVPMSIKYLPGLTPGDHCIQLVIEDGGLYDADGQANGQIEDPGVLAIAKINQLPVIELELSQQAQEATSISLDASASIDADGNGLTFSWSQMAGTTAQLDNVNNPILTFNTPLVAQDETLTFQLQVSDGAATVVALVQVLVLNQNNAPVVTLSTDSLRVTERKPLTIVSHSSDADGEVLSYLWQKISGPAVELGEVNQENISLVAPRVKWDQQIILRLTVSDGAAQTSSDITITVKHKSKGGALYWLLMISGLLAVTRKFNLHSCRYF